ncbi:MAG: hypothetical protein R3B55_03155 [Candidatus Paceibacterota bacterium]
MVIDSFSNWDGAYAIFSVTVVAVATIMFMNPSDKVVRARVAKLTKPKILVSEWFANILEYVTGIFKNLKLRLR